MNQKYLTNKYNKIVVIGSGSTPQKCAAMLSKKKLRCEFWEVPNELISINHRRPERINLNIKEFNQNLIAETVQNSTNNTLILSINNLYLFKSYELNSPNIEIINYHNSLLPNHRGVNAEAWAIFNQDNETGITWHFVDSGIDTGQIISQSIIDLQNMRMTSIKLLSIQSKLALESLDNILPDLLSGRIKNEKKVLKISTGHNNLHKRQQIPNNGKLNPLWDKGKIWSFLRAMDYGYLKKLGEPTIDIFGHTYVWESYMQDSNLPEVGRNAYIKGKRLFLSGGIVLENLHKV